MGYNRISAFIKGKCDIFTEKILTAQVVIEYTPKLFIAWKFSNTNESKMEHKLISKIDQVESQSISCAGRKRRYADISWFCAIVNYSSGMKTSIAIKLIEEAGHASE